MRLCGTSRLRHHDPGVVAGSTGSKYGGAGCPFHAMVMSWARTPRSTSSLRVTR